MHVLSEWEYQLLAPPQRWEMNIRMFLKIIQHTKGQYTNMAEYQFTDGWKNSNIHKQILWIPRPRE